MAARQTAPPRWPFSSAVETDDHISSHQQDTATYFFADLVVDTANIVVPGLHYEHTLASCDNESRRSVHVPTDRSGY